MSNGPLPVDSNSTPAVTRPRPHDPWPPAPTQEELEDLAEQRVQDISIKGHSGPIGELEDQFLNFLDGSIRYAVTFNSGTSALWAAYKSVGVGPGETVIGPALTYHAALSPALSLGANVELVDVDLKSRCIDPEAIENAATKGAKYLTVVHQWGFPADMDRIMPIVREYGLTLIEDCSHAHGSRYRGQLVGTFGDVAVFSLQAAKAVYAGEGGILVTNNSEIHDLSILAGHYRDRSRDEVLNENLQKYWVTGFGMKLRMSPLNAVVAKHSLNAFPARSEQRKRCLLYFNERLAEVRCVDELVIPDHVDMGAWYGFKPFYNGEESSFSRRDAVELMQAQGLEVNAPSGGLLNETPLFRENASAHVDTLTNARRIGELALSFPTFNNWPEDQGLIDQYIEGLKRVDAMLFGA